VAAVFLAKNSRMAIRTWKRGTAPESKSSSRLRFASSETDRAIRS